MKQRRDTGVEGGIFVGKAVPNLALNPQLPEEETTAETKTHKPQTANWQAIQDLSLYSTH